MKTLCLHAFTLVLPALFASCATTRPTAISGGGASGDMAWFAEIEETTAGSGSTEVSTSEVVIIMCSARARPPCLRIEPRDAESLEELAAWRRAAVPPATAASAPAAPTPPASE